LAICKYFIDGHQYDHRRQMPNSTTFTAQSADNGMPHVQNPEESRELHSEIGTAPSRNGVYRRWVTSEESVASFIWWMIKRVGDSSKSSDVPVNEGYADSEQTKPVFVVAWGRTPGRSTSFHKCLLVADEYQKIVSVSTTGTHYDWGSMVDGKIVSKDNPAKVSRFSSVAFEKGHKMGNTYKLVGTTNWPDSAIQSLGKNL
jgi:hypothetical protein